MAGKWNDVVRQAPRTEAVEIEDVEQRRCKPGDAASLERSQVRMDRVSDGDAYGAPQVSSEVEFADTSLQLDPGKHGVGEQTEDKTDF